MTTLRPGPWAEIAPLQLATPGGRTVVMPVPVDGTRRAMAVFAGGAK